MINFWFQAAKLLGIVGFIFLLTDIYMDVGVVLIGFAFLIIFLHETVRFYRFLKERR